MVDIVGSSSSFAVSLDTVKAQDFMLTGYAVNIEEEEKPPLGCIQVIQLYSFFFFLAMIVIQGE